MFAISGMIGCTIFFQANQLSQIIRQYFYNANGIFQEDVFFGDLLIGFVVAILVSLVIFGGIKRIALVASRMVPIMIGIYFFVAILVLLKNINMVPSIFKLIIFDAFNGDSVAGGAIGTVISIGVRRGLFSNEAGSGTETMAHGAAKTSQPIREGLVANARTLNDTIIVCSVTAFVILSSGVYLRASMGFRYSCRIRK